VIVLKKRRIRIMKYLFLYLSFLIFSVACLLLAPIERANSETVQNNLYTVGINDIIAIHVAGFSNLSITAKVTLDGTIAYPNLGTIYVKDKTLPEIEKEITTKLSDGYVKFPVVTVSLVKSESKKVFIHGEAKSGSLLYQKDLSVIKALSLIGGIGESGRFGKIKIRRKREKGAGYKVIAEVGINDGIIKDSKIEDMLLQPDDIVIIERSETFFVQGPVIRSGEYVLEDDTTVSRVLSLAGGIAEAGLHGKIKIMRKQAEKPGYSVVAESPLDNGVIVNSKMEDMLLQKDDILKVERSDSFFLQGEVMRTGQAVLEYGMTLGRALTIAGGIAENGMYGKVKIRRIQENTSAYADIIELALDNGVILDSKAEDMLLQKDDIVKVEPSETIFVEGEVVKPGQYVLEHGMTVGRAVTIAGGIAEGGLHGKVKVRRKRKNEPGYDDIEVNIKGIIEGTQTGDMLLQADDILIVERSKTYIMYGEVNSIGEYPIADNTTVFSAIIQAGGISKFGSESRVNILRPLRDSGKMEKIAVNIKKLLDGDLSVDVPLEPGDIVVVSEARLF
jgi:protein involved in polysaccharide export with SLBB domain